MISDGLFYNTRNPNYFGEILIYGSFGLISTNIISWSWLLIMWGVVFNLNMTIKDLYSYSKKVGWDEYRQRSNKLLPKFFRNSLNSFI